LFGLPGDPKVVTIRAISGFIWKPGQNNIAMKLLLPADEVLGGLVSAAVAIRETVGDPVVAVLVKCPSTGRAYVLRVPPTVQTAREAVAWTFGMTVEEYQPTAQS
jgi:hypothetical protein